MINSAEDKMASPGKVSIWVGDFTNEEELLDYIESEEGFGSQFGCVLRENRELCTSAQIVPLRELLEGFSWWRQFIEEAVALQGSPVGAHCAVVAHACDYRLLSYTPKPGPLRF